MESRKMAVVDWNERKSLQDFFGAFLPSEIAITYFDDTEGIAKRLESGERFDLYLVDNCLGCGTGPGLHTPEPAIECVRLIREKHPEAEIIVLANIASLWEYQQFEKSGAARYLIGKGDDPKVLRDTIQRLLKL